MDLLPFAAGLLASGLASIAVKVWWRAEHWSGERIVAPAVLFFGMGLTLTLVNSRWRSLSSLGRVGIALLYGILGALLVGI